ncbi:MAG: protein kinase domain-containing protein, partial [Planctomycetota bacterium]
MDDGRWQIAKQAFSKALALPPERRVEWIEAECEDEGLRLELLGLLAAHEDSGSPDAAPTIPPAEGAGVVIDRYKLLQQIGEGGFGTVYMAEQTDPVERRVALKIIKAGMDTSQVIARFEAERQALAMMDHPNIAKVLDAGATASGRPYFVMELVKGIPITEYCEQQGFGPKRRLELFIRVCHGVQHAHQKGIIHRDLKPSNVLVAEYDHTAVPKIIDFGVAKATNQRLTQKTVFTEFGQLVGTFEYMSPEQAKLNQLDIDTRSDVYSLGVLLYQLLTGTTPLNRERLQSAGFEEVLRIIREEDPPMPSTRVSTLAAAPASAASPDGPRKLSRLLRGDLDWIVMCALDKERNRRYESAGSFADDLERHLQGEAVKAGPPSKSYKLRKFIRRHRGAVIAAGALVAMLMLGLAGTGFGLVEAKAARGDAEAARDSERELTFRMTLDRGLASCDAGRVGPGMLWLARALDLAPPGETAMRRVIRANLNAWRQELDSIEMIYPHDGIVICVAFDPSGNTLATGSSDETAQLWDVRTGERIGDPLKHSADVHCVAFNADGSRLLTTALDSSMFLWDTASSDKVGTLRDESGPLLSRVAGGAMSGAFRHPDEQQLITSHATGAVKIWDLASGKVIGRLPSASHQVHEVTISADGTRMLTSCHDGTATLWELDSRKPLATFNHGAQGRIGSADFFGADGTQVVTGGGGGNVYLWNVADALAQKDRTLDASKAEYVERWRHHGNVHRLRVSPDRSRIVTASFDATARIFAPGKRDVRLDLHAAVHGAAFHPDGARVATGSDDTLARVWRPAAGPSVQRRTLSLGRQEAVYSADGRYLLTKPDDATAVIRETLTGSRFCSLPHEGAIRAVAISPDRTRILTGSADSVTRIWDVSTRTLLHEFRREGGGGIWTV